jgi:hypothetical protein
VRRLVANAIPFNQTNKQTQAFSMTLAKTLDLNWGKLNLASAVTFGLVVGILSTLIGSGIGRAIFDITHREADNKPVSLEALQTATPCMKEVLRRTHSNLEIINDGEYRRAGAACFDQSDEVRAQQAALNAHEDGGKQWK